MNAKWKNQTARETINMFYELTMPVCKDPFSLFRAYNFEI